MEKIKFSIIIPTRERADTLVHCLRTVVAQDYENLEIIVSDNFSQDNTREVVSTFSDPRIKYVNTGKRVSMSHNYEFALSHVTDGWVSIIGDDDGLLTGALTIVADVIKKTGCQAITSLWCGYAWPNSCIWDNRLIVPLTAGIELRNGRKWLGKLMRGEATYFDLPRLYVGGFVDIQAINRARTSSGAFFLSMIPDVYSALALASVLDTYVILKKPVSIGGQSSHSIGASYFGTGKGIVPAQEFLSEENIPFHRLLADREIPKSIPIIVYEIYLQSMHLHHDFLKIKLEDQLSLALADMANIDYAKLRKYCSRVAHDNNINMDIIYKKIKRYRLRLFIQQLKKLYYYIFKQLIISTKEYGIKDVFGASILAKAIYLHETRCANWKSDNLFQLIKGFKLILDRINNNKRVSENP